MPAQDLFNLVIREGLGYCLSEGRRGGRRAIVLAVAGLTTVCAGLYFFGSTRCHEWWSAMTRGWAGEPKVVQSHEVNDTSVQSSASTVGDVRIEIQPPPMVIGSQSVVLPAAVLENLAAQAQNTERLLALGQAFSLNFGS